ncbi:MAG: tryptophan--tRNA ligase [Deltaproteobacteria bacterium]|nr:tryptophan--tRNA ligase [Deltaproteobacteria bacterium]
MATMNRKRVLTGIKPTGIPHLGNYLGAIRPAIELTRQHDSFLFIADLHALTITPDRAALRAQTHSVAATWLALGIDPDQTVFYRQSDVPEIPLLAWILSCVTPLGLLNRAHSYKDARAKDQTDDDINHGVFSYPVLMAADILALGADLVPVGKDQKQHLEITQEAARKFNLRYGGGEEILRVPEALIDERVMTIPGIDGQKMSKSYENTIPLFLEDKQIDKATKSIKTDSTPYGEPLVPETDTVFQLFSLLAESPDRVEALRSRYLTGRKDPTGSDAQENYFGWGDAKKALRDEIMAHFRAPRDIYARYMQNPDEIDRLLTRGAARARARAGDVLARVREAVGLPLNVCPSGIDPEVSA